MGRGAGVAGKGPAGIDGKGEVTLGPAPDGELAPGDGLPPGGGLDGGEELPPGDALPLGEGLMPCEGLSSDEGLITGDGLGGGGGLAIVTVTDGEVTFELLVEALADAGPAEEFTLMATVPGGGGGIEGPAWGLDDEFVAGTYAAAEGRGQSVDIL